MEEKLSNHKAVNFESLESETMVMLSDVDGHYSEYGLLADQSKDTPVEAASTKSSRLAAVKVGELHLCADVCMRL